MSVCVKGMYLPPSCYFCPMTNDGLYICKANNPHKLLEEDCEERRPDWCPIIEVPVKHGRLIDADALAKDLDFDVENDQIVLDQMDFVGKERARIQFDKDCKQNCMRFLSEAHTIIPASEEVE